jgi:hypothetical protein
VEEISQKENDIFKKLQAQQNTTENINHKEMPQVCFYI